MKTRSIIIGFLLVQVTFSWAQIREFTPDYKELKENKDYFLLGTLHQSSADKRVKNPSKADLVQTYSPVDNLAEILHDIFKKENSDLKLQKDVNGKPTLYSTRLNKKIDQFFTWKGNKGTLKEDIFKNDLQKLYYIAGLHYRRGEMNQDSSLYSVAFIWGDHKILVEKLLRELGCQEVTIRMEWKLPLPKTSDSYIVYFTPTEKLKKVLIYCKQKPVKELKILDENDVKGPMNF